jgi:hypothetical protein
MAKQVLTDAFVLVNGVNLSDHTRSVTTNDERASVDVTAMGATNTQVSKGLGDASIEIEFYQDFAAASVHATLQPLVGSTTPVAVEVRATSGARSATNPAILLSQAFLMNYTGLDGSAGDASTMKATFRNAGTGMSYPTS